MFNILQLTVFFIIMVESRIFLYLCINRLHVDAEAKAKIQKLEEAAAKGVILYAYYDS